MAIPIAMPMPIPIATLSMATPIATPIATPTAMPAPDFAVEPFGAAMPDQRQLPMLVQKNGAAGTASTMRGKPQSLIFRRHVLTGWALFYLD